jgi:hypothetical protein
MALQNYLDQSRFVTARGRTARTCKCGTRTDSSGVVDVMARGMHLLWKTTWTL